MDTVGTNAIDRVDSVGKEYAKLLIETLPKEFVERVIGFIFQLRHDPDDYEDETAYLLSIPGMREKLLDGMKTPLSECIPLEDVWDDV